ncbi:hypothetical protein FDUTEX481_08460 [Tolypothrix sp. PCC 7601]|nr:hypothetical protein FDUTEX481_08460 [Tolypothrix sp. PCC 7601]
MEQDLHRGYRKSNRRGMNTCRLRVKRGMGKGKGKTLTLNL